MRTFRMWSLLSFLLSGAAMTMAMPTLQPQLVSRMVRREQLDTEDCGRFVLKSPAALEVRSYNSSDVLPLGVYSSTLATANNATEEFRFQSCDTQGFTQGYSANSGGSMGAPIEYWGRVLSGTDCLAANASRIDVTSCNATDSAQWFRLQEGVGGAYLDYFPVKNETGYVYSGQTPYYFKATQNASSPVLLSTSDTEQYVHFTTD